MIRFGAYDRWKLASPFDGDDTEPLHFCEYCNDEFTPEFVDQMACVNCYCYECDKPKDGECVGECEAHVGQHLDTEGVCELCEQEIANAPARMREQVEGLRGLL